MSREEQEARERFERQRRLDEAWRQFRASKKGGRERRLFARVAKTSADPKSVKLFRAGEAPSGAEWDQWKKTNRRQP